MLTDRELAVRSAAGKAEMSPLRTARDQLKHLVDAIAWEKEHFDKTGELLRIQTDEAAAVVGVLDKAVEREPAPRVLPVNHPVLVALRWALSQHGDSACLFGQAKHHPRDCPMCNIRWIVDCLEGGGKPPVIAQWTAKHPDLVPVTLAGLEVGA